MPTPKTNLRCDGTVGEWHGCCSEERGRTGGWEKGGGEGDTGRRKTYM